jgi:ActR/RegA family two-component response regulator
MGDIEMEEVFNIPGIAKIHLEDSSLFHKLNILMLEDQETWASETKSLLESMQPCDVTIAKTINEASVAIKQKNFDAWLIDANLGKVSQRGDEWLLENWDKAENAYVAVLTAYPHIITNKNTLESRGVRIAVKSKPDEDKVYEEIGALSQKSKLKTIEIIEDKLRELINEADSAPKEQNDKYEKRIYGAFKDIFVEWANTRIDPQKKELWIKGKEYSIAEIKREIISDTDVGKYILMLFTRQIRYKLGLAKPPLLNFNE